MFQLVFLLFSLIDNSAVKNAKTPQSLRQKVLLTFFVAFGFTFTFYFTYCKDLFLLKYN